MTINFHLLEVRKITCLRKISSHVEAAEVRKITCLKKISSHGEAANIKFGQQVNLIQRVVTSLPQNHMTLTNLFISHYRVATVIKFRQ